MRLTEPNSACECAAFMSTDETIEPKPLNRPFRNLTLGRFSVSMTGGACGRVAQGRSGRSHRSQIVQPDPIHETSGLAWGSFQCTLGRMLSPSGGHCASRSVGRVPFLPIPPLQNVSTHDAH
ncbi:hypothetical protein RB5522 [Rhodopirellula baltica SH 1]|uniref:Uncharacterized protein n=1 Tax=Rhodopirellula baltica (strain DSM 10527 / NCIMB 13988 / SH1) TaxID=243090 RepID=Q7URP8_RHOBA|nr:hypothetical protein RB5522 [Rhodopirellula baltica SH 1]